jgi:hypothetical protein
VAGRPAVRLGLMGDDVAGVLAELDAELAK